MSCQAMINHEVSRRGRRSHEFTIEGKKYYYCLGYIDRMTDEPLETCRKCKNYVDQADEDMKRLLEEEKTDVTNTE